MPSTSDTRIHLARRRSALRDPRLIIGVCLILASVLLTSWLVQRARGGEETYQLTAAVAQGQRIDPATLVPVKVRTGSKAYLPVGELPETAIASRSLGEGELLPRSAVISEEADARRQVVLTVENRIPSSVEVGDVVEVWAVARTERAEKGEPQLVTDDAIVLSINNSEAGLTTQRSQVVEVSVTGENLNKVLAVAGSDLPMLIVPRG